MTRPSRSLPSLYSGHVARASSVKVVRVNGIAFVGSTLVARLRAHGIEASLVEPPKPGAGIAQPWKLATGPLRVLVQVATAVRLRSERSDLVHVHYATQALPGRLAGRPYLVHCHGSDVRAVMPESLAARALRPLLRGAAAVLVSTPDLIDGVRRFRDDAAYLPNPIMTAAFAPAAAPTRDVLVGTKLEPVKGVETEIKMIGRIRSARPETTFTVIRSGSAVEAVREAAGPGAVTIEPVPHAEMAALFTGHRLTVGQFRLGILSQYELESMAAGTPVLTGFRLGSAYVDPPPLAPMFDAEAASAVALALLTDEPARLAAGRNMRAWVVANHDVEVVVERLLAIYRSILGLEPPAE